MWMIMANHIVTWKYKFLMDSLRIGNSGTGMRNPAKSVK